MILEMNNTVLDLFDTGNEKYLNRYSMFNPYFFNNLLKTVPSFENMSIFCYNSIPWGKAEVVVGGSKLRLKCQYKEVHFIQ